VLLAVRPLGADATAHPENHKHVEK
jgi:hypothetical protein